MAQDAGPGPVLGTGSKGVMLMNRIGPSASELYIANSDGSDERKLLAEPVFDYHASYSADGKWIVFTSERAGRGQADIYRARPDGTAVERLTDPRGGRRSGRALTRRQVSCIRLDTRHLQGEHLDPRSRHPTASQSDGPVRDRR
jgi:hypothetical protein